MAAHHGWVLNRLTLAQSDPIYSRYSSLFLPTTFGLVWLTYLLRSRPILLCKSRIVKVAHVCWTVDWRDETLTPCRFCFKSLADCAIDQWQECPPWTKDEHRDAALPSYALTRLQMSLSSWSHGEWAHLVWELAINDFEGMSDIVRNSSMNGGSRSVQLMVAMKWPGRMRW
jgi:hypothetical protein